MIFKDRDIRDRDRYRRDKYSYRVINRDNGG